MTVTRRRFVGRVAGAAASAALSRPALSRPVRAGGGRGAVRVGVIGLGVRGKALIADLPAAARVTALCDCAASRVAGTLRPTARYAAPLREFLARDAARCAVHADYREMIAREPLDAVIIATPDHHHVPAALHALHAGLHVYLEKPLSLCVREGRVLVDAVAETGRVLQVGSQQRSMALNRLACEFVRDGGLGRVARVDLPNYPGPLADPGLPAEPVPDGLDWDLFLGPAPARPHNRRLWVKDEFAVDGLVWRGWDLFRDYSGHLTTNWGGHSVDMVQYALGRDRGGPVAVEPVREVDGAALERDWRKKWFRKTPPPAGGPAGDWSAAARFRPVRLRYDGGPEVRFAPGVGDPVFHGERGRLVIARNRFRADPPGLLPVPADPELAGVWRGDGIVARPHLADWLDCIASGRTPAAPAEVGHRTATVCHLVNIARRLGRPLRWDPAAERFPDDPAADALLDRPRRPGFELPADG